jgi:hypothetical protein
MTKKFREHLHTGSMLAAAALGVTGFVLLWGAVSFEGYISALLLLAVAAVCFVAGRELTGSDAKADRVASPDSSTRRDASEQEATANSETPCKQCAGRAL